MCFDEACSSNGKKLAMIGCVSKRSKQTFKLELNSDFFPSNSLIELSEGVVVASDFGKFSVCLTQSSTYR